MLHAEGQSDYAETLEVYYAGMLEQKIATCRNRKCDYV